MEITKHDNMDFYKTALKITVPVAVQNIISYGVNLMDTVMLGRLGETALSASSMANQLFFVYNLLVYGIGGAAVVFCSRFWGAGNRQAIQKVLSMVIKITMTFAFIFAAFILFFPREIMELFTNDEAVIAEGIRYLKTVAVSYLFYGMTSSFLIILRSVETVNISLKIYIMSFFINVFCNYCFIFGKFGFPAMGTAGAAAGTAIARGAEFLVMTIYMLKFDKKIKFRFNMLSLSDKNIKKDMLKYGMPVIVNELLWGIGISVHISILGHISSDAVAANSICNVVFQMITSFILGMANASSVIIGRTIGEGRRDTAKEYKNKFIVIYFFLGIATAALLLILKGRIIEMYNITEKTRIFADRLMYVYAFHIFFMAFTSPIIAGVLRGGGDTRFAAMIDVGFLWLLIPIGAVAAFVFKLNPVLTLLLLRFETPIKWVFCMVRVHGDKWIKEINSGQ